jgi:hypothetical protein
VFRNAGGFADRRVSHMHGYCAECPGRVDAPPDLVVPGDEVLDPGDRPRRLPLHHEEGGLATGHTPHAVAHQRLGRCSPDRKQTLNRFTRWSPGPHQTLTITSPALGQHLTSTSPSPHQHLTSTSPAPHQHLTSTSPAPRQHLTSTSPAPRQHLASASPVSHQHLASTSPAPHQHLTSTSPAPSPALGQPFASCYTVPGEASGERWPQTWCATVKPHKWCMASLKSCHRPRDNPLPLEFPPGERYRGRTK